MRGGDVFLRGRHLVLVEKKNRGIDGGMRIVQTIGGQFFHDLDSVRGAAQAVERKRVGHGGVHIIGRAIVGFLRDAMAFGGILVDEKSEARVVRGGAGLVRRGLMQTLRDPIEIRKVVAHAIDAEERVERLAPQRRALGKTQPELLGFN